MLVSGGGAVAQQAGLNPYFPAQTLKDGWKMRAEVFASDESNSNTFTNAFVREITRSGYLDQQMKEDQLKRMNGHILTGTLQSIGGGVYFRSGKLFYYTGLEHQHILDSRIGSDLARVLMLGNKPFAGTTMEVPESEYNNVYFNRLALGAGYTREGEGGSHSFVLKASLTSGQNYDQVHVDQASMYTHPEGDYLDIAVRADTKVSDTVWAGVFDLNGLGVTLDMEYSLLKEKDFYFAVSAKNLGFINWNGNTFVASADTAFRFEGVAMDTTSSAGGGIPDDYSYKNLRSILFRNPEGSSFTTGTPVFLNLTGGKYFGGGKYYAGLNLFYYPTLNANYKIELFGTWNYRSVFHLTPIVTYSAYRKVHFGLAAGVNLGDNFRLQAGTNYLDSYFIGDHPAGRGGFIKLVFLN